MKSRLWHLGFGLLALPVVSAGCGAVAESPLDYGVPVIVPDPNSVPYDVRMSKLLDVPGGLVHVGDFRLSADEQSLGPEGQCTPPVNVESIAVGPFRLMQTEVSNIEYSHCVESGGCAPPDGDLDAVDPGVGVPEIPGPWTSSAQSLKPVAASYSVARMFCRHYGGDLPTVAQFWRAVQGDSDQFVGARLTRDYLGCRYGKVPSAGSCDAITTPKPYAGLFDVGQTWDYGPYGHLGLFGNAAEWLRSPMTLELCGKRIPEGNSQYPSPDSEVGKPPINDTPSWKLARNIGDRPGGGGTAVVSTFPQRLPAEYKVFYYLGFRCAFPSRTN